MAYKSLSAYDPVVSAGIIARLALAIHYTRAESSKALLADEATVRTALLAEVREELGIAENDNSVASLTTIVSALYEASDTLLNRIDEADIDKIRGSALSNQIALLAAVGEGTVLYTRSRREQRVIEKMIQNPGQQYSIYMSQKGDEPSAKVIYTKVVRESRFSYLLIVVAERKGKRVRVNEVVRYYGGYGTLPEVPGSVFKTMLTDHGTSLTADNMIASLLAYNPEATCIGIYAAAWVFAFYQGGGIIVENDLAELVPNTGLDGFYSQNVETVSS